MTIHHPRDWIIPALLLLGVGLRVHLFVLDRGLWLDEAMVAVGIVRLDWAMITDVLDYGQQAPFGYVMLVELSTRVFGEGPMALRLPALLAGLGVLPLAWQAVRSLRLAFGAQVLAVALVSVNPYLIYYANEVKQYSSDAFFSLALIVVFLLRDGPGRTVLLALLLTVGLFFSHPLIFTAAAVLIAEWMRRGPRNGRALLRHILPLGFLVLLFFSAHYFLFVRQSIAAYHDHWFTMNYHREFFMPLDFWNPDTILWYPRMALRFMTHLQYFHVPVFGWLVLSVGVVAGLWRSRWRAVTIAVLLAFVFAGVASALQLYTLKTPRMMLYAMPFMALLLALGVHVLLTRADTPQVRVFGPSSRFRILASFRDRYQRPVLLLTVTLVFAIGVLAPLVVRAWRMLDQRRYGYREEIAEVFPIWQERRAAGDGTYVHYRVQPIVHYHCLRAGMARPYPVHDHIPGAQFADTLITTVGPRGWAFFSTTDLAYRGIIDRLEREYRINALWSHDSSAVLLRLEAVEGTEE